MASLKAIPQLKRQGSTRMCDSLYAMQQNDMSQFAVQFDPLQTKGQVTLYVYMHLKALRTMHVKLMP